MSASGKDKKDLLGDLENIKNLLDDASLESTPASFDENTANNIEDIPLLSDVVPKGNTSKPSLPSTPDSASKQAIPEKHKQFEQSETPSANTNEEMLTDSTQSAPEAAPKKPPTSINSNPFIPYEAINKLKKERQSMKNFAAEVMQAAQQGLSKNDLDQFDLFKYSRTSKPTKGDTPSVSQPEEEKTSSETPTLPRPPSDAQLESMVNQVINDCRPALEEAMRDALLAFYKNQIEQDSSK